MSAKENLELMVGFRVKECSLALYGDSMFVELLNNGSVTSALREMLLIVQGVNSIFKTADIDGDGVPCDLQFGISSVTLLKIPDEIFQRSGEISAIEYLQASSVALHVLNTH